MRSSSSNAPGLNVSAGPYREEQNYPKFTKTGLMISSGESSNKNISKKSKPSKGSNQLLESARQSNLQTIKEASVDLSYLKKVKSKVDCWTSKL